MKKKYFIVYATVLLILQSCEKSKEVQMQEFVSQYYKSFGILSYTNPYISSTSAEKTAENEITIRFYVIPIKDSLQGKFFKESLTEMLGVAFADQKSAKKLASKGVSFRIRVLDDAGQKLFLSKTYNKNSFDSIKVRLEKQKSPINDEFGEMRELVFVLNQKLPLRDEEKGISLMKIDIDEAKNLIYTVKVDNEVILEENKIIKRELLRDEKLRPIFKRTLNKGIRHVIFRYENRDGKLIKLVGINPSDVK